MLFIIGYFIGKAIEKKETKEETEQASEFDIEENFSYSDLHDNKDQMEEDQQVKEENEPMHDHYEFENPEEDFNENAEQEINTLENFFTKEEIEKARKVSKDFIKALYTFDGDNPTKNITEALKFVTEPFKEKLQGNIIRPTHNYFSREYTDIFVYEPYNPTEEVMNLKVRVEGKVLNSSGQEVRSEIVEYDLKLVPFEDTFKINDYSFTTFRQGDKES